MITLVVFIVDALLLCVLADLISQIYTRIRHPETDAKAIAAGSRKRTEKMVLTGMLLAFALALKYFSITLPLFGSNGMRFSLGGIFTAFPAILFGPVYGGITSALSDLLGFFMKPSGDYNFLFTLTAFIGGFLKGLIWLGIKKTGKNPSVAAKSIFGAVMAVFLAFGTLTMVSLNKAGIMKGVTATADEIPVKAEVTQMTEEGSLDFFSGFTAKLASTKGEKSYQKSLALYCNLCGIGCALVGLAGLLALVIDAVIAAVRKKKGLERKGDGLFMKLLICLTVSGIIVTTVNTEVLIKLYGIKTPFLIYWLPRLAEEFVVCAVQAYCVGLLYKSLEKLFRQRGYV